MPTGDALTAYPAARGVRLAALGGCKEMIPESSGGFSEYVLSNFARLSTADVESERVERSGVRELS